MKASQKRINNEEVEKVVTIKTDAIDNLMFESMKDATKFLDLIESDQKNNSEGLCQDAFTSFFAHEPLTDAEAEPVQKGIIDTMMGLDEYNNLRAATEYDELSSAVAAMQFGPDLIKQYIELKKKFEEKKKENESQGKEGPKNLKDALSGADMAGLRNSIRKGLEKAQKEADDLQDAMANWGVGHEELQKAPPEQRMKFAETVNKSARLKKISDLAGKFRNIFHTAAATVPVHGVDEVVDIGLSDDISRMLPTELVKLEETPDLFCIDFIEKKLMTYNMKGTQDLGKGPIIACIDNSGSMSGERIEWACAVAISLMALAEKQKRAFGVIVFNDGVCLKKFWGKSKPISFKDKMEVASIGVAGGTDFYKPLEAAFKFRKEEPELRPADVIFITDGDCHLDQQFLAEIQEQKEKTNTRIYGILINDGYYGGSSDGGTVGKFSDQFVCVNSLGDMDNIRNLAQAAAAAQGAKKAKT